MKAVKRERGISFYPAGVAVVGPSGRGAGSAVEEEVGDAHTFVYDYPLSAGGVQEEGVELDARDGPRPVAAVWRPACGSGSAGRKH